MNRSKSHVLRAAIASVIATTSLGAVAAESDVEALQRQLAAQQALLEQLQRQLREQQELTQQLLEREGTLEEEIVQVQKRVEADELEYQKRAADRDTRETVRLSKDERVQIVFSGQVNRMANVVDDGESTDTYFVDNDASNSRIRFVGTAKATDDLTVGSRIELSIAPDESSRVNQVNETTGDFFDQRWTDLFIRSERYGTLYIGKGDTASNNAGEVDLSKTDVIQYASIADMGGGLLFRDRSGALTDVRVSSAFQDEDGLSRASRVRYDTPRWNGFYASASAVSDARGDASLWWSGKVGGFTAAGAVAVANRNVVNEDLRYDGSLSIVHDDTGLNLTLSAGRTERDGAGVDDQENFYVKVGWLAKFFDFGPTALGIDYTDSSATPSSLEDGESFSFAAVQEFPSVGTELYAVFRQFSLDSDDPLVSYQDINMGTLGARVRF